MKLLHKESKDVFVVVSGKILAQARKDIDGSFLTLKKDGTEETVLYLWKYFADNDYEVIPESTEAQ